MTGVELQSAKLYYSSVFSTSEGVETEMYVVMNTLIPVDVDEMIKKVVSEYQQVNGDREKTVYKIHLYRTELHYRENIEYDMVVLNNKK